MVITLFKRKFDKLTEVSLVQSLNIKLISLRLGVIQKDKSKYSKLGQYANIYFIFSTEIVLR